MPPKLYSSENGVKVDIIVIALELYELMYQPGNELALRLLVSFFSELDTRQGTMLHLNFIIMNGKGRIPRVPLHKEGQHLGN